MKLDALYIPEVIIISVLVLGLSLRVICNVNMDFAARKGNA